MRENEIQESGNVLAVSTALMNILILTIGIGVFQLIQVVFSNFHQLNQMMQGFMLS